MRGVELTPEWPVDRVADLGARAEEAGFEHVFVASHYNNRDPFVALSRIATRTDEARLGPAGANPLETHPVALAGRVATLAEVSDGRAALGIGPGDPSTLRNLGLADQRGLRPVLEAFRVARRLWDGGRVTHDGTFDCVDAGLNFEPPGEIPVHVAGEGPGMCRMAAKHADGLLFNGAHPADLSWARERVTEGLAERERREDGFRLVAYASVSVARDDECARAAARPAVAFITAGAPPPVLGRHGIDAARAEAIGEAISAGQFSAAFQRVTPAMIDAFSIAGTPERVTDRMAAVLEHADGVVAGAPLGPDEELETAIDLAAGALDRANAGNE
jgi:5,10-methylenetetrahydromethanopterin reductase